jgi:chromosome segregation ATPase
MATEETLEQKNTRLEAENKSLLGKQNAAEAALTKTKDQLNVLQNAHSELKADHDHLSGLHKELSTSHQSLLKESSQEIERLSQELDSAKSDNAKSILTTTVDGKKFRVIGKSFSIKGKGVLSVEQVLKDKALLKDLVKQQVGFLVAVD